jgi:hypothetical protein
VGFSLDQTLTLELQAAGWAADQDEITFLVHNYLLQERGFLLEDGAYKISPKGWAHLDLLRQGNLDYETAFIAMWFDDSMNDAWKAIDKGIRDAGYAPLRIDQKQHNNEINDEIIAEIRKSKFLVADLTDHRNGVYFEAGFAKGLGLEVVWLCRRDALEKAHFGTRQYNFIVWEQGELPQLTKHSKIGLKPPSAAGRYRRKARRESVAAVGPRGKRAKSTQRSVLSAFAAKQKRTPTFAGVRCERIAT